MCELKAYLKKTDSEELILEAVNQVRIEGDEVVLKNLFGEEKRVRAEVREVSLVKSRVLLEPR
jgi:predicted RNA-binding protein